MRFTTQRGRPKSTQPEKDKGTQELQQKKRKGITADPLDLCLKYELITESEHQAATHYRWLYTLSFGLPDITGFNPQEDYSAPQKQYDERWLSKKEQTYRTLTAKLKTSHCHQETVKLCIYKQWPRFLVLLHNEWLHHKTLPAKQLAKLRTLDKRDYDKLKQGLSILKAI